MDKYQYTREEYKRLERNYWSLLIVTICLLLQAIAFAWGFISIRSKYRKNAASITQETRIIERSVLSQLVELDGLSNTDVSDSLAYSLMVKLEVQHPHIALAQMKLESGNYESNVAKSNNNYFGMRHPAKRLTVSLGDKGGYARYRNWAYSILDYALWQRRYAYDLTEEQYLEKLGEVYAEDKNYIGKVKNIAENLEYLQ